MSIEAIVVTTLVAVWIAFILWHKSEDEAMRKHWRQETNDRLQAERAEEDAFVADGSSLLPDYHSAIQWLAERYSWDQLLKAVDLTDVDIELLASAKNWPDITLPNLQTPERGPLEARVVESIRKSAEAMGIPDAPLSPAEPTTDNLELLAISGYLTATPRVDNRTRRYTVHLTETGYAILLLHKQYKNKAVVVPKYLNIRPEIERELRRVMRFAELAIIREQQ